MKVVSFKVNEETLSKIDEIARQQQKSRSELIRSALNYIFFQLY